MYQGKEVTVVVLAAGRGSRMQAEINKQYIMLGGMPVLTRTLLALEHCEVVDHVVLVTTKGEEAYCEDVAVVPYSISKVKKIVTGGASRQDSCRLGMQTVQTVSQGGFVLFQDGARPFLTEDILLAALEALTQYDACCVAVPVKDTIKVVDETGKIVSTPDRATLYAAQTPQGFHFSVAKEIYEKASAEGFTATDDSQLAEHYGYVCKLVMGSYENIKITTREDLVFGENILKTRGVSYAGGISEPNKGN